MKLSQCDADEAADAGLKGLVQMRLEGGQPQAPKAVSEGLSTQQIDGVLQQCKAQEVCLCLAACPQITLLASVRKSECLTDC